MTKITIVNDKDEVIGSATSDEVHSKGLNYRAVHIFLFNKKGELLIGKRPDYIERFPGVWTSGSGGKVDEDETYFEAANRELEEELGIKTNLKECCSFTHVNELFGCIVFHRLFIGSYDGDFILDLKEVAETKWVTIDWIRKDVKLNPKNYASPFISALKTYLDKENI